MNVIGMGTARAYAIVAGVSSFLLATMFFTMTTTQGSAAWVCTALGACTAILGHYGFDALLKEIPDVRGRLAIVGAGYGVGFAGAAALFV